MIESQWFNSQVKKLIMKNLKGHVKEVAKSEHGHLMLLALFDTVDDTVLLRKVCVNFRKFVHNHVH